MNTSIIVCNKEFNIGTKVVLWDEINGFNGYDTSKVITKTQNRKTGKIIKSIVQGKRYSKRTWRSKTDLDQLKKVVKQFFLHHSGLYRSRDTFNVLHNQRRLSVHFILDDDGTLYQTLDLREKAFHGGGNNSISVGIEIDSRAHAGKHPDAYDEYHCKKYKVSPHKKRIDFVQNQWIEGYEYTEAQYETLIRLGIVLGHIFPKTGCMFFPTNDFRIIKSVMNKPLDHKGLICHYNNSSTKIDPIAFDHYRLQNGILLNSPKLESTFLHTKTWKERQEWLKILGFYSGPIDGDENSLKRSLMDFQGVYGLVPDGDWGPRTEHMIDLRTKEMKVR